MAGVLYEHSPLTRARQTPHLSGLGVVNGSDVEPHDMAEYDVEDGGGGLGRPRHGVSETVLRSRGDVGDGDGRLDVGSRLHRLLRREMELDLGVGLRCF